MTWLLHQVPAASAGEGAFLWNASGSVNDLAIRTGLALDLPGRPRFGAESTIRVSSQSSSGTVNPPLRMWGEFDVVKSPDTSSTLGLVLNPESGAARAALRQSRTIFDVGPATVSVSRTMEAGRRTDGQPAYLARQDLRLAFSDIGATLAGGVVMDNRSPFDAELRLEKQLPLGVSLKATLSDLAHEPAARLNARFERQW